MSTPPPSYDESADFPKVHRPASPSAPLEPPPSYSAASGAFPSELSFLAVDAPDNPLSAMIEPIPDESVREVTRRPTTRQRETSTTVTRQPQPSTLFRIETDTGSCCQHCHHHTCSCSRDYHHHHRNEVDPATELACECCMACCFFVRAELVKGAAK